MVHFRDPIHGDLIFGGVLEELMLCDEFQRLTEIKQLGTSDRIYPGATHTRFAHSLGACFLAGELAKRLHVPEQDHLLLQIAALLHDIGHYDFSHALEHIAPYDHEENGKRIILGQVTIPSRKGGQISAILHKHGIKPEQIVELLHKEGAFPRFYYALLSSPLIDADRLDFLKRDSHYTGALISVDISRLLTVLVVHPETKELGVMHKGVPTIEQFLVARNHMYRGVYFHPLTDIGETMLLKAAEASKDVALPLMYGDDYLLSRLSEQGTPLTKMLIQRLRGSHRGFYETAFAITPTMHEFTPPQDKAAFEKKLLDATGLSFGEVLISSPGSHRKPAKELPKFPVLLNDGTWTDLFDISPIAKAAMHENVSTVLFAVYTLPEHVEKVRAATMKLLQ
jgi:uncharacterized protein